MCFEPKQNHVTKSMTSTRIQTNTPTARYFQIYNMAVFLNLQDGGYRGNFELSYGGIFECIQYGGTFKMNNMVVF
jgi:hypothetical protein